MHDGPASERVCGFEFRGSSLPNREKRGEARTRDFVGKVDGRPPLGTPPCRASHRRLRAQRYLAHKKQRPPSTLQ